FPNSTRQGKRALWLPSAFTLSEDDIDLVCRNICEFMEKGSRRGRATTTIGEPCGLEAASRSE
ncbi:MAG: hypothetical protein AMJ79_02370, partial [Phycisphaerae bacterium SM23_30]